MLVAVDIGNTTLKIGFFRKERLICIYRFNLESVTSLEKFKRVMKRLNKEIDAAIICSVVPKFTRVLKKYFEKDCRLKPLILGHDLKLPVKNLYYKPEQVGQDRLVNVVSAFEKFGGPALVIDFGTAITFDLVSRKGEYLGGIIAPGIETSLNALSQKAALLPKIKFTKPKRLIGRETKECMNSGAVFGFSALVEGLLDKIRKKWKKKFLVIATGGGAKFIATYCPSIDKVESNLTLEGLNIIFRKIKKKG